MCAHTYLCTSRTPNENFPLGLLRTVYRNVCTLVSREVYAPVEWARAALRCGNVIEVNDTRTKKKGRAVLRDAASQLISSRFVSHLVPVSGADHLHLVRFLTWNKRAMPQWASSLRGNKTTLILVKRNVNKKKNPHLHFGSLLITFNNFPT